MFMLEIFQLMEKICIKNMSLYSFEKNETAIMFSLEKSSLVLRLLLIGLPQRVMIDQNNIKNTKRTSNLSFS